MQILSQINESCTTNLPYYQQATIYAQQGYRHGVMTFNQICKQSTDGYQKVVTGSEELKKQAWELADQTADQLLEFAQGKLKIEEVDQEKKKRVVKIANTLKKKYMTVPVEWLWQMGAMTVEQTKKLPQRFMPMYFTLRATYMVAEEMMMEIIANRFGEYKAILIQKHGQIVLKFRGVWEQMKIQDRLEKYGRKFRNMSVKVMDGILEFRIKKDEFIGNFYTVIEKLGEIVSGVKERGVEKLQCAKRETMDLYESVLRRIREKEIKIRTEYGYETDKETLNPAILPKELGVDVKVESIQVDDGSSKVESASVENAKTIDSGNVPQSE